MTADGDDVRWQQMEMTMRGQVKGGTHARGTNKRGCGEISSVCFLDRHRLKLGSPSRAAAIVFCLEA